MKKEKFFASLKSLKKGVGSGSIRQRGGSGPAPKMSRIPNTGICTLLPEKRGWLEKS
jgi:hypothetical protein